MSSSSYSEYHVPETAPPADLKAPCPPPLAAAPSGDFWNETQWKVLLSLLDAVVPSIVSESDVTNKFDQRKLSQSQYSAAAAKAQASVQMKPSDELLKAYLQERMLDKPAFVDNLKRTLDSLPPKTKNDLGGVLSLLSSRAGAFVLTGYCTPVQEQPIHIREAILQSWLKSWIGTLRGLGKSLTMVAHVAYLETSPLFKQITGYPDVPADWKAGRHFDYTFLQFPADPAPAVIETDVVVVGSGCGGAVVARTLAEAGHRVVVVDKGSYFPPSQLPMPQEEGSRYMYENQGFIATEDGSLSAVAGGCWGGGGAVNWSVCLQTQGFVRREWARQHGLAWFETQDFQDALDRVCGLAGASEDGVRHPHRARVVLDGARRLGWHAKATPVNSAGEDHWCGHCHLGCGGAGKLSTVVSWLPAAAEAGARFIEGFLVDRVLFDDDGKKATGVVGTWTSRDGNGGVSGPLSERTTRQVEIRAKKVVLSAGSLWSPLILMKSGVKNRNLGRNLRLHPCNFVSACFEEETRPWEGGIITSVCTSFENLDGQGHGVKLEPTCMLPYAALSWVPWRSGLDFKLGALRYRHLANFISLTRDRDSGSVFPDPVTGRPRIDYTPSRFDAAHTLEGAVALAQMCYVAGATEIAVVLPGIEPFVRAAPPPPPPQKQAGGDDDDSGSNLGVSDPAFEKWIAHVRKVGNRTPDAAFSSAHQMGTCRMSSHAGAGVVDPRGRVWGREALYVADASVFPSASGVNPMVTNMAIADHIARGIARELVSGA